MDDAVTYVTKLLETCRERMWKAAVLRYETIEPLNKSVDKFAAELFSLEAIQHKLDHYVSLLEVRQADVLRLLYYERISVKKVAECYGVDIRTVSRIKKAAIKNLAEMYEYLEHFKK